MPPRPAPDEEPTERLMTVNAEGQATGPTVYVYASGVRVLYAYYVICCQCPLRAPFFSPWERDLWAEAHRVDTDHCVQLSVEPWDYTTPPWSASLGIPLPRPQRLT